ncbi:hypothetical protein GCM10008090_06430 [Arenicella chitinivorans]|uniref:Peptidase M12B domain-containing protein n=1 Tax=Arenicella chitinivorans TaxID=1329800 RepID=A0A918RJH1_9GAMM|nr:M12 family metallo-peptidase [Arenicella chitinivorans]GHA00393.1 hypothetical protein GCM10008090_06430 [Arenicella chitinivorans]
MVGKKYLGASESGSLVGYWWIVALVLSVCSHTTSAQTGVAPDLFSYSTRTVASKMVADGAVQSVKPIDVNRKIAQLKEGDTLQIPMPDGALMTLEIYRTGTAPNGDVQLWGKNDDTEDWLVITFGKKQVYASFGDETSNYSIGWDQLSGTVLIDAKQVQQSIDLADDIKVPPSKLVAHDVRGSKTPVTGHSTGTKAIIGVMAIYSDEFSAGFSDPVSRINQMIAFTNAAYDRSGVNIQLELARAQQLAFNNSASTGTLLDAVTDSTGVFSTVPSLRNQYFADLVAVLPYVGNSGVAGIAWINGESEAYGFSVTQFASWGSDSVFAHEIGHNLGSGHERASANSGQPSPCDNRYTFEDYACGHGNGSQGTIMSYLNDAAWNYVFSNPDLNCNGEPCGVPAGQSNQADNRRAFNSSGPLVAGFRYDPSRDVDSDGVFNEYDNCPNVENPDQTNSDGDAFGDVCDDDSDNDGVNDDIDNCPLDENADQADADSNGLGDVCDPGEMCFPVDAGMGRMAVVCL